MSDAKDLVGWLSSVYKADRHHIAERINQAIDQQQQTNKRVATLNERIAHYQAKSLRDSAVLISDIHVVTALIPNSDRAGLRVILDDLKQALDRCAVVLAVNNEHGKVDLVAGVSKSCTHLFTASELSLIHI